MRGRDGAAERASIADAIDRATELPDLLEENERLHEIKTGAFAAVDDLRRENERLRAAAERARRWVTRALTAPRDVAARRLDAVEGQAVLDALGNVCAGTERKGRKPTQRRRASHRSPAP